MNSFNNNPFKVETLAGMVDNLRINGLVIIIGEI